jgi:two-component system, sensor histidine kinase and response regulator
MKPKILVVENEVVLLEGIRDVLEREDFEVVIAENGQQGLDVLRTSGYTPDLILSDVMMPIMDGYEFIKAVRAEKQWVEIPFIFLTAKSERPDKMMQRMLGADDYLGKPFMTDELVGAINAKLRRRIDIEDSHRGKVDKIQKDIMTILHHEFRTPLTYVTGYSDLLKVNPEDITADELRLLMGKIEGGAQRLRRLIENFIMLVEIETGSAHNNFALNNRVDNYRRLLASLVTRYQQDAERLNQHLTVEIDPNTPPIVSNADYMMKIMDCLLDNAMKFSRAGATTRLSVFPTEHEGKPYVAFQVEDNGIGIAEKDMPHIFEPFFQAIRSQNEHPGTGTGLAIAKGLTELHGGEIDVQSRINVGSVFTVLIPAVE